MTGYVLMSSVNTMTVGETEGSSHVKPIARHGCSQMFHLGEGAMQLRCSEPLSNYAILANGKVKHEEWTRHAYSLDSIR